MQLGSLSSALGFLLLAGWRDANRIFTKHFAGTDITPGSLGVMILVQKNPGCSINQVCRTMGITPNNMVRLVDRLCDRSLVKKSISKEDRRARALHLTAQGEAFLKELISRHSSYEEEFHGQVGQERVEALRELLLPFVTEGESD